MIKISNDEPVVLETSDYRIEFCTVEQLLAAENDRGLAMLAQRIYDKKNGVFIKERFVGPERANAILNFALGV